MNASDAAAVGILLGLKAQEKGANEMAAPHVLNAGAMPIDTYKIREFMCNVLSG